MTSMADIVALAEAEGIGGKLPDGRYILSIKQVKSGHTQGGAPQFSIQWQVVQGPASGSSWMNQNLSSDNPKAMAAFVRVVGELGISPEQLVQINPDTSKLDALAAYIGQINANVLFSVDVTTTQNGQYTNTNFRIQQRGVPAGAVAAAAPAVSAPVPVVPVAAVAPQPVVVPQPVVPYVTPGPPTPAAAAAVAAVPADQQAQFEAFLAQQAAAQAAPVVAAPPAVVVPVQTVAPAPAAAVVIDPATGLPARPGNGI